uniref:Uncharacterized protein n=1 Tax=Periophthalmus magnuspinnatus TaxID=409849 RepID=A0A3B4B8I6_9GOBI
MFSDLVKTHLRMAVRDEVQVLRETIRDLQTQNQLLQQENRILRAFTRTGPGLEQDTSPTLPSMKVVCVCVNDRWWSEGPMAQIGSLASVSLPRAAVATIVSDHHQVK